jgi:hypothetical protein
MKSPRPRRPFSMLRAAFWLLAIIVCVQLINTLIAVVTCMDLLIVGIAKMGECSNVGGQAKEVWSEALAAVLALLLAARENGKPPPTTLEKEQDNEPKV